MSHQRVILKGSRRQAAGGRRQAAGGRRQAAGGTRRHGRSGVVGALTRQNVELTCGNAGKGRTSRPIGRVLSSRPCGPDGRPSIYDCRCRQPPAVYLQASGGPPLASDLAPGGVYRAARVASHAGGLLHHRFTLTPPDAGQRPTSKERSAFCGTVPRVTPGGRYPPPCPVEPGPSSVHTRRHTTRSPGRLVRRTRQSRPSAINRSR
jgi:hypothetical protein